MESLNRFGKPVKVLVAIAIATTGMSIPAIAGSQNTTAKANWQLAQASLSGQCRAVKVPTPIFKASSVTSQALRLLAADEQVTLADNAVTGNGFIGINAPISGFVQAINLKPCSSGTGTPTNKGLCRQVARPPQGLVIRRTPTIGGEAIGGVAYLEKVTLTTNPPTIKRADDRDWVEISAPVKGWVSNGLVSEKNSNLIYCE
jgi:hypothetical protein